MFKAALGCGLRARSMNGLGDDGIFYDDGGGQVFNSDVAQDGGGIFNSDTAQANAPWNTDVGAGPGVHLSNLLPSGAGAVKPNAAGDQSNMWNAVASVFRVVGAAVPGAAPILTAGQQVACAVGAGALCANGPLGAGSFPPGSITAFQSGRGWLVAAPRVGVGIAPALHGMGLGDPPPNMDRSTMARQIGVRQAGRQPVARNTYGYAAVKTASSPYRAVHGLSGSRLGYTTPPAYMVIATTAAQPPGLLVVSLTDFQTRTGTLPWYKNLAVWAGIGGVAAAGTIGYVALRKKRAA